MKESDVSHDLHERDHHTIARQREEAEVQRINKIAAYAMAKRGGIDLFDVLGITECLNMTEEHKVQLLREIELEKLADSHS